MTFLYLAICMSVVLLKGPLHIGGWIAWPVALLGVAGLLVFLVLEVGRTESRH